MMYYCTFGDLQNELRSHYHKTGERIQFIEAIDSLYNKGKLVTDPEMAATGFHHGNDSADDFESIVDAMYFPVMPRAEMSEDVLEKEMIPNLNDGFIIRHPRYTRPYLHKHDYVEMDYVVKGSCTMYFEEEVMALERGDFSVIAPYSTHDIEIKDESIVYCIMLRRSTFQSAFFSLLSRDDVLSHFFRNMLTGSQAPNYMVFHTDDENFMKTMVQSMMQECHHPDKYANQCCISLVNMLLACLLRSCDDVPEYFYGNISSPDFTLILKYIRHNFRTVTLSELAERFHYSKPHLCTLIKQNTGVSFSVLIRQVRMTEAREYLTKTPLSVSDIADIIGYNSSDHFARVFRGVYGMSPLEYRKKNTSDDAYFIPLKDE